MDLAAHSPTARILAFRPADAAIEEGQTGGDSAKLAADDVERLIDLAADFGRSVAAAGNDQQLNERASAFAVAVSEDGDLDHARRAAHEEVLQALDHLRLPNGTLPAVITWQPRGVVTKQRGSRLQFRRMQEVTLQASDIDRFLGTPSAARWFLADVLSYVQSLRALDPPLPRDRHLREYRDHLWQLAVRDRNEGLWGCFLIQEATRIMNAAEADREEYQAFVSRVVEAGGALAAIQNALRRLPTSERADQGGEQQAGRTPRTDRTRAVLSYADSQPQVRYGGVACDIPHGLGVRLFHFLWDCHHLKQRPIYKQLFEALYPNDMYREAPNGGPPEKLRQLVSRLNTRLRNDLPSLPNDRPWIKTHEQHGYYLTDAVTWQAHVSWKQRGWTRESSTDPSEMDQHVDEREDEREDE